MNIGLTFLGILLFVSSIFMMLLILVQRGKGGGLTGALGGMGGQSAFGSKAGDVFTRITIITAMIWITLCMITIAWFNPPPKNTLNANRPATMSGVEDEEEQAGGMGAGDSTNSEATGEAPDEEPENIEEELSNLLSEGEETNSDSEANEGSSEAADEGNTPGDSGEAEDDN